MFFYNGLIESGWGLVRSCPGMRGCIKKSPVKGIFLLRQEAGLLISVSADHLVGANVGYVIGVINVVQITFLLTI